MTKLLKGKDVADAIDNEILEKMMVFYEAGIVPTLAIVRVGENGSDIAYENGAIKRAKKIGIETQKYTCPKDIEEDDLIAVMESINQDEKVDGVLLLQPLPAHIDGRKVRNAVNPEKDLDCISEAAIGRFFAGAKGFGPCTAESSMEILKFYGVNLTGKRAVVIGRSMVIGKPVARMLMDANATVTVCHTKTSKEDLVDYCKTADIIVAAAGKAGTVTSDMVKSSQTIIDVGINFTKEGKMMGDVDFESVSEIVGAITPVPGGVGSVTTALLMRHLIIAAQKRLQQHKL